MPRRERELSEADIAVWQAFARGIGRMAARAGGRSRKAKGAVAVTSAPKPGAAPVPSMAELMPAVPVVPVAPAAPVAPVVRGPVALIVGTRGAGLDDRSWRALKQGRLAPSRRLDLHGRTADAALAELQGFLLRASADRLRCVEIVTGLGSGETGGILRRELPHWLNRPELRRLIVAVSMAQPGNAGAVRLILRRRHAAPDTPR